jgi:hypothetical protein
MVCAMRGPPDQTTRTTKVGAAATAHERAELAPLGSWPASRVVAWCAAFNQQHCGVAAAAAAAANAAQEDTYRKATAAGAVAAVPVAASAGTSAVRGAHDGSFHPARKAGAAATSKPWLKPPLTPRAAGGKGSASNVCRAGGACGGEDAKLPSKASAPASAAEELPVCAASGNGGNDPPSPTAQPTTTPLPTAPLPATPLVATAPTATAAPRLTYLQLPRGTDGKALVKLTAARLAKHCQGDVALGQRAYRAVRLELSATAAARDVKRRRLQDLLYGQAQYLPRPGDPALVPPPGVAPAAASIPEENAAVAGEGD